MESEDNFLAKIEDLRKSYIQENKTEIEIPQLISIPNKCFRFFHFLVYIKILKSVTSIGNNSFDSCQSLTEVSFEPQSNLNSIGSLAFYACKRLKSIEIPNSVSFIGDNAFRNCIQLTHINISENMKSIENSLFHGCSSLQLKSHHQLKSLAIMLFIVAHHCQK